MKAVILAGGLGTRLSEETVERPKPMVEIGGRPIIWHIMKHYSSHGINDFIICCGYKGYIIKEYFHNYLIHNSDIVVDINNKTTEFLHHRAEPWRVTMVDTGPLTMTGGRLLRIKHLLENEEAFCMTYGDGVSDVDLKKLVTFHKKHGRAASLTAVYPKGRFGSLEINDGIVDRFTEKPAGDGSRINGGFFVLNPTVFSYLKDDSTVWEEEPLTGLTKDGLLMAYEHDGFWQPMDTLRDKHQLEKLWNENAAPWKLW